jgi:glycosyltransferase involved in cell wall biosynthesis
MVKEPMTWRNNALPYRQVSVEVVIPVYNEEAALPRSIETLCDYLENYFPYRWSVLIADNASTDDTLAVAQRLAAAHPGVSVLHLDQKGRGRALKTAWLASGADVVAYMDVDLSTNLSSFLPLVAPLATGHSDLSIGSRLFKGATVTRQWKREAISRCYNLLIKLLFGNRFSDAQCGFKALKGSVAQKLLPQVEDEEWFFDTELLLLAEKHGLRIYEVPVEWNEDLDSRVEIIPTAVTNVNGLLRVRTRGMRRRLAFLTPAICRSRHRSLCSASPCAAFEPGAGSPMRGSGVTTVNPRVVLSTIREMTWFAYKCEQRPLPIVSGRT